MWDGEPSRPEMLIGFIIVLLLPSVCGASVCVFPRTQAYDVLERLSTEGMVSRYLLSGGPPTREEVQSAVSSLRNQEGLSEEMEWLKQDIVREFGKAHEVIEEGFSRNTYLAFRLEGLWTGRNRLKNVDVYEAFDFSEGPNFAMGLSGGMDIRDLVSVYRDRISVYGEGYGIQDRDGFRGSLRELCLEIEILGMRLGVGRERVWHGPGYHGDFVLTDNAPGFMLVRIERCVGPFWGRFLLGKVDNGNTGQVFLNSLSANWFYADRLEIGASLGAVFQGDEDLIKRLYWPNPPGDVNQVLEVWGVFYPMDGVKLYGITAGDDWGKERFAQRLFPWAWKSGYLVGAYLSDPLGNGRTDFRVEWTRLFEEMWDNWYTHDNAYYHKGWIIGHHMGRDWERRSIGQRDLFVKATHLLSREMLLTVEVDTESARTERAQAATVDRTTDVRLGLRRGTGGRWDLSGQIRYFRLRSRIRMSDAPWEERDDWLFRAGLEYQMH